MDIYNEHRYCRNCGDSLETVLDLGEIYPSNFVDGDNNNFKAPLELVRCVSCGLVQLRHTVNLDLMYRKYWYRSGLNSSMVSALEDVVKHAEAFYELKDGDVVVDIGCNDGTLFDFYSNKRITKIGFEPAENLVAYATPKSNAVIADYFSAKAYERLRLKKASIVTSIAMFYDLEEPNSFIGDVNRVLAKDGIWIIQLTDLVSMLKLNAFDNICHEHLEYYSLHVLVDMLNNHGLKVFDVSKNRVNGGSIRVFVQKGNRLPILPSVSRMLGEEANYLAQFHNPYTAFVDRVLDIKEKVNRFIYTERSKGKRFSVLGASTKGNTLLQYFGIDNTMIESAAEINSDKYGLKTVGTNILIKPENEVFLDKPDYMLVLPWHFINNFVSNKIDYLKGGGKFLVPCPEPAVINMENGWEYL